jgi:predicted HNH restriction endonuclease
MDIKQNYKEYLLSDRWRELRKLAIHAACGKCQLCNSSIKIEVHHREYPKVLGEEPLSFLTVLCHKCHKMYHRKAKPLKLTKRQRKDRTKAKQKTYELAVLISRQCKEAFKDKIILRKPQASCKH